MRDYTQLKFELAGLINEARSCAIEDKDERGVREYQALQSKLANDGFHLAVIGQSSRGKSTLMNAVLGMDRLPTGIVPITSVITSVCYGSRERVILHFRNSHLRREIPLASMAENITENGNPGNSKGIELAEVQLPAEVLRRGFFFIDTPGIGSAVTENTETTREYLPSADAIVFVTSFDAPFTNAEHNFFRDAVSRNRKVFLVVNKLDLASPPERESVIAFLQRRLMKDGGADNVDLIPLSARQGLEGKLEGDSKKLEASGIAAFESRLVNFLTSSKSQEILAQTAERLEAALAGQETPRLERTRKRLTTLKAYFVQKETVKETHVDSALPETGPSVLVRPCFVCGKIVDGVLRFLSQYQYELFRNPDEQERHARRNGFCPLHSWQYGKLASPQGVSSACPKLVLSFATRLGELSEQNESAKQFAEHVREMASRRVDCLVCESVEELKTEAIKQLIASFDSSEEHGRTVTALCLPHLPDVLEELPNANSARKLLHRMSLACEKVAENMQSYALKHSGVRWQYASEDEKYAADSGLTLLSGHRNVQPGCQLEKRFTALSRRNGR